MSLIRILTESAHLKMTNAMQSYYVSNNLCGCFFFVISFESLKRQKTSLNWKWLASTGKLVKTTGVHSVYGAPYSGKVILIIIILSYFFLKILKLPVSNLESYVDEIRQCTRLYQFYWIMVFRFLQPRVTLKTTPPNNLKHHWMTHSLHPLFFFRKSKDSKILPHISARFNSRCQSNHSTFWRTQMRCMTTKRNPVMRCLCSFVWEWNMHSIGMPLDAPFTLSPILLQKIQGFQTITMYLGQIQVVMHLIWVLQKVEWFDWHLPLNLAEIHGNSLESLDFLKKNRGQGEWGIQWRFKLLGGVVFRVTLGKEAENHDSVELVESSAPSNLIYMGLKIWYWEL